MGKSGLVYLIKWVLVTTGTLFLAYIAIVCFESYKYWHDLKGNLSGWIGKLHRADNTLGYVPIPRSLGAMFFCDGATIPVYYDSQSFRSSSEEILKLGANGTRKPDCILSLGCSFSFGFGVPATSTFCHLIADELGMVPLNAGRCSYGLAEMLILARRLIPEFKPKIVLVQYSPWLVERSQQRYGPTFYGLLPHPYFVEETVAGLNIHGPDFMTAIFRHDFATTKISDSSIWDLMNFTLNLGFPLMFHDLHHSSLVGLKNLFGLMPQPSRNQGKIVSNVYGEIASICKQFGSKMFIVALGTNNLLTNLPDSLDKINVQLVNAQLELVKRLPESSDIEYSRSYHHWGSEPPRVIDKHPNALAHEIIADSITKSIIATLMNERKSLILNHQ